MRSTRNNRLTRMSSLPILDRERKRKSKKGTQAEIKEEKLFDTSIFRSQPRRPITRAASQLTSASMSSPSHARRSPPTRTKAHKS